MKTVLFHWSRAKKYSFTRLLELTSHVSEINKNEAKIFIKHLQNNYERQKPVVDQLTHLTLTKGNCEGFQNSGFDL